MSSIIYNNVAAEVLKGYMDEREESNKIQKKIDNIVLTWKRIGDINLYDTDKVIDCLYKSGVSSPSTLASTLGIINCFLRFIGCDQSLIRKYGFLKDTLEQHAAASGSTTFMEFVSDPSRRTSFDILSSFVLSLMGVSETEIADILLLQLSLISPRSELALIKLCNYDEALDSYVDYENKCVILRPLVKIGQDITLFQQATRTFELDADQLEFLKGRRDAGKLYAFNEATSPIVGEAVTRATEASNYKLKKTFVKYGILMVGNRKLRHLRAIHDVVRAYQSSDKWSGRANALLACTLGDGHLPRTSQKHYSKYDWLHPGSETIVDDDDTDAEVEVVEPAYVPLTTSRKRTRDDVVDDIENVAGKRSRLNVLIEGIMVHTNTSWKQDMELAQIAFDEKEHQLQIELRAFECHTEMLVLVDTLVLIGGNE